MNGPLEGLNGTHHSRYSRQIRGGFTQFSIGFQYPFECGGAYGSAIRSNDSLRPARIRQFRGDYEENPSNPIEVVHVSAGLVAFTVVV